MSKPINPEIVRLRNIKASMKQSLIDKGIIVGNDVSIGEYANFIDSIPTITPVIATDCRYMCYQDKHELIKNCNTSQCINFNATFQYCDEMQDDLINSVDFSSPLVTTYNGCLNGCSGLVNVELAINLTKVSDMRGFLQNCTNLISADLSGTVGGTSLNGTYGVQSMFNGCKKLEKVFIPDTFVNIPATQSKYSPFYNASTDCVIYTNASEKLAGWDAYWNYASATAQLNVIYGVTHEQFIGG